MSITIDDCLKLKSLHDAEVIAGHKGLNNIVSTVSVLENADISLLAEQLFSGNELIISAFTSVKDDVDAQCKALYRLNEVGESGIIIYYVGIFVKKIDEKLIKMANELNFPLIIMPPNQYNRRYSEVITEVIEAIFEDEKQKTYFVSNILDRMRQLQDYRQNTENLLRMLSDRLRCSLLLVSQSNEICGFAGWPMALQLDYFDILDFIRKQKIIVSENPIEVEYNNQKISVRKAVFDTKRQNRLQLYLLDERVSMTSYDFNQSTQVLQMFSDIWNYDFGSGGTNALIRSILKDEPILMRQLAKKLSIDISMIRIMWVLKECSKENIKDNIKDNIKENIKKNRNDTSDIVLGLRRFLKESGKVALVDIFKNDIVGFMDEPVYTELDTGLAECYLSSIKEYENRNVLFICSHLEATKDVRYAYMLLENCFNTACTIYPVHKILTIQDLQFTNICMDIITQGEEKIDYYLDMLLPLQTQKDNEELMTTLSVFLLDTKCNIKKTSELMYLHKNTIKYRINKIVQYLGFQFTEIPGVSTISTALALKRILK